MSITPGSKAQRTPSLTAKGGKALARANAKAPPEGSTPFYKSRTIAIEGSKMNARNRIIVALDVGDIADAAQLVEHLEPYVGGFKVGLEFITGSYTQLIARLPEQEAAQRLIQLRQLYDRIAHALMWDGKFSDIPNTIAGATKALQPLTPKFFTV